MYTCSYDRMKDKIETFSKFGDAGHGGITRYSLSPEAIQARNEFRRRMEAIGAVIEVDDVACMYATLPGSDPDAKRIVMGSHVDSVKNGGNYDGILGVMSAMEVLETVAEKKIPHKHPLTAMIWTNEEGSLYPPAMMCSGIICYDYLPEDIRSKFRFEDMMASKSILDNKSTFGEALEKSGFKGDRKYRISPEKYMYMFETHIERGIYRLGAWRFGGGFRLCGAFRRGLFRRSSGLLGLAGLTDLAGLARLAPWRCDVPGAACHQKQRR